MDPESTQPNRSANTPRNLLHRLLEWCQQHPDWLLAALLGFIAGAVLL